MGRLIKWKFNDASQFDEKINSVRCIFRLILDNYFIFAFVRIFLSTILQFIWPFRQQLTSLIKTNALENCQRVKHKTAN